jgi:MOSC domain-containing protein YiiM
MATIFQLNTSSGGVPKTGHPQAVINNLGLEGDQHRYHGHGGPQRALCIYSLERIQNLQAEGHPVFPGAMGENLTITGLDWDRLAPGARLQLGDQVLAEITEYTVPCNNLTPYFINGDFSRVSQKEHPGWARLYARVLQGGSLKVGDPVKLLTGQESAFSDTAG